MASQKRPLPSVAKAKAPTLRTIADIYDAPFQAHAFDPPIGAGGGGVFSYTAGYGLYGDNNANTVANYGIQIGYGAYAEDAGSIAIGSGAGGTGFTNNSIFIGVNAGNGALGNPYYAVIIGYTATGRYDSAVSIGNAAYAGLEAIGIGKDASGGPGRAVALGASASAGSADSMALGPNSSVVGTNQAEGAIAIGQLAAIVTSGGGAIAIGESSSVTAAIDAIAIGHSAAASALRAIAIGGAASATHQDSVAIGRAVVSAGADTFTLGVSATSRITFDTWTPAVSAATPSTHKLQVIISGATYYLLLTT